jgi:hypothetical protein
VGFKSSSVENSGILGIGMLDFRSSKVFRNLGTDCSGDWNCPWREPKSILPAHKSDFTWGPAWIDLCCVEHGGR